MPTAAAALCAILLAALLTPARGSAGALAGGLPATPPRAAAGARAAAAAPRLPPDLASLVKKMEGLTVSSVRFRLRTALSISRAHVPPELQSLLKLFDIDLSGEATTSPPAGSFALTILGHTLRLRVVHGVTYVYEPAIARRDRGRPWIDLGHNGLGTLLGGSGAPTLAPGGGGSSFKRLAAALTAVGGVSELGPGLIDGQAITGFRGTLPLSLLEEPADQAKPPSILRSIFAQRAGARSASAAPAPASALLGARSASAAAAPGSALLEAFIAPGGLPVRTRIAAVGSEGVTTGALLDVFAIDFPLRVQAPPRRETVGLGALRKLAERGSRHRGPEQREDDEK